MVGLTVKAKQLIDGKNFGNVATIMPDGSPQVATVWVDREGDVIKLNATVSRQRTKNLRRDPRVALVVFDQANPYSNVMIRGKVTEITKKGAEDHIDQLSMKYHGRVYSYHHADDPRVIIRIEPEHIT